MLFVCREAAKCNTFCSRGMSLSRDVGPSLICGLQLAVSSHIYGRK